MVAKWTCTECHATVTALSLEYPPEHGRCLTCQFIHNAMPDLTAEQIADLRRRLHISHDRGR